MTWPPPTDPRTSILRFPSSPPPSVVLRSASPKLQGSPIDHIFQNLSPLNIGYEAFSASNVPLSVFSSPYDSQSGLMGFCDSDKIDASSSTIYYPENDILFEPLHIATLDKGNMVSSPSDWFDQCLGDDVDISSHNYAFGLCGLLENDNNGLSDFGDAVAVPTTDSIYNSEFMLGATMESLKPISYQNENVELFNTLDNELTRVVESCNSKYFVNLLCGEDNQELLNKEPSFGHPIGRPLQFKETLDGKHTDDVTRSATNLISSAGTPSSKCVVQSHVQLGQTSRTRQEGSIAFPSTSRMHHLPDSLPTKQLTEQTVLDERGTPATQDNDNGTVEGFGRASVLRDRRTNSTSDEEGECKKCCCKRSKCLKLYCECFRSGSYCDGCGCENCHNTPVHKDAVADARRQIENRTATAFAPKVIRPSESMPEGNLATPASARHRRGCNCRKSMCNKKYCECYQSEVGCSDACRCDQCSNFYGTRKGKAHHQSTKREIFGDIRNLTPLGNEGRSRLQITDSTVWHESPSSSITEHSSCLLSPDLLKENYTPHTLVNLPIPATNTQASSLKRQGASPPQSQSKKLKISSTDSIKVIDGL